MVDLNKMDLFLLKQSSNVVSRDMDLLYLKVMMDLINLLEKMSRMVLIVLDMVR